MNLTSLKHQNVSICQITQHHMPNYDYLQSKTSFKQLNWREVNFKFCSRTHRSPSSKDDLQVCALLSDTHSILSVSRSIQIFYAKDQNLCTSEIDNLNLHVQSFRRFPAWSLKFRSLKHSSSSSSSSNNNNQINIISSNTVQATSWLSPSSWVLGYPLFGIYSYNNFGMHILSNLNKCHVYLCA